MKWLIDQNKSARSRIIGLDFSVQRWHAQSNLDSSNTDGSFIITNSNWCFESLRITSNTLREQIFQEIVSFYHEFVYCVYSLESPHRLTLSGSKIPYLEQISMVPVMFESLKFDVEFITGYKD